MDLTNGTIAREIRENNDILFFPGADDISFTSQGHAFAMPLPKPEEDAGPYKFYIWEWDDFRETYDYNFRLPAPGCVISNVWVEV